MAERTNIDVVLRLRDNATRALNAALRTMTRRVKTLTRAIFNWRTALLGIASVAVTGKLVKGVIDVAAGFERTEVMLRRLYGTAGQARGALNYLIEFGSKVPFGMKAVQDAFVKLKVAGLDPMKGSMQDLANAVAAFGGTDQDLQRASVAIFQMAGKGVVSMEELRRQLGEAIPSAIKIMARELDLTMDELVKRVSTGNLKASIGLPALFRGFRKDFAGATEAMASTWEGLLRQLSVQWDLFRKDIAGAGVFAFFKNELRLLLANIKEMRQDGRLDAWALGIAQAILAAVRAIIQFSTALTSLFSAVDQKVQEYNTKFYTARLGKLEERMAELRQIERTFDETGELDLGVAQNFLVNFGIKTQQEAVAGLRSEYSRIGNEMAEIGAILNEKTTPAFEGLRVAMAEIEAVLVGMQERLQGVVDVQALVRGAPDVFPAGDPSSSYVPPGPAPPNLYTNIPGDEFVGPPAPLQPDLSWLQIVRDEQTRFFEESVDGWDKWGETLKETWLDVGVQIRSVLTSVVDQTANVVSQVIVYGASLGEALKSMFQSIAAQILEGLVKFVIGQILQYFIDMKVKLAAESAKTYAAAFASAVGFMGPAAGIYAATMVAQMQAGAAGAYAAGSAGIGGASAFHGGMNYVPRETTYLLDKGERVLSPRQNEDLTDFLNGDGDGGGGGRGGTQVSLHIDGRELGRAIVDLSRGGRIPLKLA